MDFSSPPSLTRSPTASPTQYCGSDRSPLDYPSPVLLEQHYKISSGFGPDRCMAQSIEHDPSQSTVDGITPAEWHSPTSLLAPVSVPVSSGGLPTALSSEYDVFAGYATSIQAPYPTRNIFQHHQHSHSHLHPQQQQQQQQQQQHLQHLQHHQQEHFHSHIPDQQPLQTLQLQSLQSQTLHSQTLQSQALQSQALQPRALQQLPHQLSLHHQHGHQHGHQHHQQHLSQQHQPHHSLHGGEPQGGTIGELSPSASQDRSSSMHPTVTRHAFGFVQPDSGVMASSLSARLRINAAPSYSPTSLDMHGQFHHLSPRSMQTSSYGGGDASPYPPSSAGYQLADGRRPLWRKADLDTAPPLQHDFYHPPALPNHPVTPPCSASAIAAATDFGPDPRRALKLAARHQRRAPRRLTTKEEANFQCDVKGCGKLFSRSYNFKAHMETHDEKREYPFPCKVEDCTKKFVRKTDLQRHNQSVHMKERNFKCDYCSRLFARKDTLRRHMDDGCSKRFDLGMLDLRLDGGYETAMVGSPRTLSSGFSSLLGPQATLPPLLIPPLGASAMLASMPVGIRDGWAR